MKLTRENSETWLYENPRRLSPDLMMPRWVRWDEAQSDWLIAQLLAFAAGQATEPALDRGSDQLRLQFGGNDHEPTLILQNTHVSGENRGTAYLSETDARELVAALRSCGVYTRR